MATFFHKAIKLTMANFEKSHTYCVQCVLQKYILLIEVIKQHKKTSAHVYWMNNRSQVLVSALVS